MRPWVSIAVALLASCSSPERQDPSPSARDAGVPPDDKIAVPAGWFTAGCVSSPRSEDGESYGWVDEDCFRANPPRRVWLSSFEIDRRETTRAAYRSCLDAGACHDEMAHFHGGREVEHLGPARVKLADAEAYCRWRGDRLPTLAEWEKAARGAHDARAYPWGDAFPDCTRSWKTSEMAMDEPCPYEGAVGMHPAGRSPYGVEDLYGSAKEWTSTYFAWAKSGPDVPVVYEEVVREGTTLVLASWKRPRKLLDPEVVDPKGPPSQGHGHVLKGATDLHGQIGENGNGFADDAVPAGFRCVRSVSGPPPPVVEMPPPGTAIAPYREPGFEP